LDPLYELADDLDHAFDELAVVDPARTTDVRRKLAAYLDALYALREYRQAQLKKAAGGKVWEALVRHAQVPGAQHVEAHLVARGNRLHSMTKMAPPALTPLYASERLAPSEYLAPGENLTWLAIGELDEPTRKDVSKNDADGYFESLLAGLPVIPAAHVARECLRDWDGFSRLSDAAYAAHLRRSARPPAGD